MTVTVAEATQDISNASVADPNIRFCDPSITTTTLVGSIPQFTGETVLWEQTSGPALPVGSILTPNASTTQIANLDGSSTYEFTYTITNAATLCDDSATVTIRYSTNPITITANGGNDIMAACGVTEVDIPFITTGNGTNAFSIISGPSDSGIVNPGSFQNTSSPLTIDFDVEGTYTIALRRSVSGSVQTGCNEGTDAINVTISLTPTASNAGTGQNLACNVTSTSVTGNAITTGTSLWSQVSGPSAATIASPFSQTTNLTDLIPGIYTFRYTVSGGNVCSPTAESDVQVVVSSNAGIVTAAGPDQNACFGTPLQLLGNTPPSENLVGTWTIDSPVASGLVFEDANDPFTFVSGLVANTTYVLRWSMSIHRFGHRNHYYG